MIKIYNEYKGTFEVSKAFYETFKESCSTDETRMFLNYVYFDGDNHNFVATDGRRLIKHYDSSIGTIFTGFYELAKIGKKYKLIAVNEEGTFPNYQKVLPNMDNMENITVDNEDLFELTGNLKNDSVTLCEIIRALNCNINIEFLTKVLKHVGSFKILKNSEQENTAIMIEIDNQTNYVIMPICT